MSANYDRISLTARITAYMRQFSDIPYARDIAGHLRADEAIATLLRDEQMKPEDLLWYAPIFEIRYKSIERTIRECGAAQVLDLASGFSLRGLAMTRDSAITYIESDLPDVTAEKVPLVAELRWQYAIADTGNFRLAAANALDAGELRAAVSGLRRDLPLAVVSEGLLQYLSRDEMRIVAANVRELLGAFAGGAWITPDFSFKRSEEAVSDKQRRFREIILGATGRRLHVSAFDGAAELDAFLDGIGLEARMVSQVDLVPDVVSMGALNLPPRVMERIRERLRLWIVRRRTHAE